MSGSVRLKITGGEVLVDLADAPLIYTHKWHVTRPKRGGAMVRNRRLGLLGRHMLGLKPGDGLEAKHLNGDPFDYRRSNLAASTVTQRNGNRVGWGKTGVSGVYVDKRTGLYQVRVRQNGRLLQLW